MFGSDLGQQELSESRKARYYAPPRHTDGRFSARDCSAICSSFHIQESARHRTTTQRPITANRLPKASQTASPFGGREEVLQAWGMAGDSWQIQVGLHPRIEVWLVSTCSTICIVSRRGRRMGKGAVRGTKGSMITAGLLKSGPRPQDIATAIFCAARLPVVQLSPS